MSTAYSSNQSLLRVLADIAKERRRQDAKHGFIDLPDGTGSEYHVALAPLLKAACDVLAREGLVTWGDILVEEVFEALAEASKAQLRDELIHVAAVCVKWVQWLDLRDAQAGK